LVAHLIGDDARRAHPLPSLGLVQVLAEPLGGTADLRVRHRGDTIIVAGHILGVVGHSRSSCVFTAASPAPSIIDRVEEVRWQLIQSVLGGRAFEAPPFAPLAVTAFVLLAGRHRHLLGEHRDDALAILLVHLVRKPVQPLQRAVPEPAARVRLLPIDPGLPEACDAGDVPRRGLPSTRAASTRTAFQRKSGSPYALRALLFCQRTNMA
jgi:hypothetical protein